MSDNEYAYDYFVSYTGTGVLGMVSGDAVLNMNQASLSVESLNWIREKIRTDNDLKTVVLANIIRLPI